MQTLSPLVLATVRAMTPQIAGLPALPEMALFPHRKKGRARPGGGGLVDILLQAALELLPEQALSAPVLRNVA
ncbi:hypothetical protein GCM10010869_32840 [Mesorhizobium tianshanense]|uniref:Uncharacterized protein n=1 Tax=Mesorhizobium tianshanense TaxID=39844 RepID=A0A562P5H0_9HYPH|nr:hypothetical protein [Mesorhizobium tianshanense]TWI39611.1 hypothetical protein IQ26_01841 [Mesorhizobium tianshanense]GLS37690.1 hypothetical protein GCM10010869_32840 [Mesorhizobium tianshanense]